MKTLVIGGTEYKIKFGYEATARCGVIDNVTELEDLMEKGENMKNEDLTTLLALVPKILVAGLQKFHKDEFGYNYETGEGKDAALNKTFELVDDYFDENKDTDIIDLFNLLTEEMVQNGFLAQMLQSGAKTQATAKAQAKKAQTKATKKATA